MQSASDKWKRFSVFAALSIATLLIVKASWELRWSPDYLTAWGTFLTGIGTVIVALGALYAAKTALADYREKTQVEKAKWLSDLFKQLFVDPTFKKIRQKIDFDEVERKLRAWAYVYLQDVETDREILSGLFERASRIGSGSAAD